MEIFYSFGTIAEIVFFAYVLKVVSIKRSQALTAYVYASYYVSHTFAGLSADWLLNQNLTCITGLLWQSAIALIIASLISFTFR
jgi:hypothetical protein